MSARATSVLLAALALPSVDDCDGCHPVHQPETTCFVHDAAAPGAATCPNSKDTEPNDRLPLAQNAGPIDCGAKHLVGTLAPSDVDVHHLAGPICKESHLTASWMIADGRLCMFAGCDHGLMNFSNCTPGKGSPVRFGEGILGCCIDGVGTVELVSSCGPLEKTQQAWIVVERSGGGGCEDYEVDFHD